MNVAVTDEFMLALMGINEGNENLTSAEPVNGMFTLKKPAATKITANPITKLNRAYRGFL